MQRNLMLWWVVFPYPALTLIKSYKKDPKLGTGNFQRKSEQSCAHDLWTRITEPVWWHVWRQDGVLVCWSRRLPRI